MSAPRAPSTLWRGVLIGLALILAFTLLLALAAPTALGRMLGDLWITTLSAVMGIFAPLFGG